MFLVINGTPIPKNPSSYVVTLQDIDGDGTKRSESGVLSRERSRAGVYKVDVGWTALSRSQLKAITDALSGVSASVTFFDPTSSTNPTKTMYASDRVGTLSACTDEAGPSYWDLSLSLIEF